MPLTDIPMAPSLSSPPGARLFIRPHGRARGPAVTGGAWALPSPEAPQAPLLLCWVLELSWVASPHPVILGPVVPPQAMPTRRG